MDIGFQGLSIWFKAGIGKGLYCLGVTSRVGGDCVILSLFRKQASSREATLSFRSA